MTPIFHTILLDVQDRVATVTLNRPDSRNALNSLMCAELVQAMTTLAADPAVHVVLITGAGSAFCAGADLKERKTMSTADMTARRVQGFAAYGAIERMPQPVIAVVHGPAFGSGCEIASACDFVLASSEAMFCYPEVGWGTVGATQRLPRIAGARKAKELLFTGRRFDAAEACEIGLVNHVHAPDALGQEALAMARHIAGAAPLTVRLTKRSIDQGLATTREGAMAIELLAIEENLRGTNWQQAIAGFGAAESGGRA
ncbi:enoyl-CoA hydratase/isomerase family protein [Achromobacter pestifer]|uniref:Short-chain-enoyl-CoA hydratase n=1 Tax=Achromobacter pestifer TaxID=1353889 RepID=A0A6S7A226_9BURK|nr:enoyl-CoA hydratase/isomerase family protein [Achromobacter pestifer]CAB3708738.1 Short-chain-enoyl-CoA hydratase [Achromobacter pestifer]